MFYLLTYFIGSVEFCCEFQTLICMNLFICEYV